MKKCILYIVLLVVGLVFSSCSDQFLQDMNLYDSYLLEKIFGIEFNLDLYIQNVYYNYFYKLGMIFLQLYGLFGNWNDYLIYMEEKWGIEKKFDVFRSLKKVMDCEIYFGSNLVMNIKNDLYSCICSCNEILEGVDKYGQDLLEVVIKKVKGQVYFFCVMQLFDLVCVYGVVFVVNKVFMVVDCEGVKDYNCESVEICVNQILSDLKEVVNLFFICKEWGSDQYGWLIKEVVLVYRSCVVLVFVSFIFNVDWNNIGSKCWKDVLDIILEVQVFLSSEGYGLYGNFVKDWNEMFYKFDNQECKEVIMVKLLVSFIFKNDEYSGWQKIICLKIMGGSGFGYYVFMGMLDIFLMVDGFKVVNDDGEVINGYDCFLFFKNCDLCFYYMFIFFGVKWGYDQDVDVVVWNYCWSEMKEDGFQLYYYMENEGSSLVIVCKMFDLVENSVNIY